MSFRAERGVLRGLHFQIPPRAQGKLVRWHSGNHLGRCRRHPQTSPTYGRHVALELSATIGSSCGTTRLCAWLHYVRARLRGNLQSNRLLAPESERGIAWNDPGLGMIGRYSASDIIIADKDAVIPALRDATRGSLRHQECLTMRCASDRCAVFIGSAFAGIFILNLGHEVVVFG